MLDYIQPHIKKSNPRIINKWIEYVESLTTQLNYIKGRYLNGEGYESKGVQLLRGILSFVEIHYLDKYNNDFERYIKYLRFIQNDLVNIFDPVSIGKIKTNCFIAKTHYDVDEYIIPVKAVNVFDKYPFDKKWINNWERVKTVRLIDHDSDEYTLFMNNDQVRFKKTPPTLAMITIDPAMLGLQYYNYIKYCPDKIKGQREFIHHYVLDSFFEDLLNIWLIKQINNVTMMDDRDIVSLNRNDIIVDNMYGFVGSRYEEAMTALYNEFRNVRSGATRPEMIINSRLLMDNSILDRANVFINTLDIDNQRQYLFLEYLRDKKLVDLITNIFLLNPEYSECKNLINKLSYQYNRLNNMRVWNNINDPIARMLIESSIKTFIKKLDGY